MDGNITVCNDSGNSYVLVLGQLLLQELKCIRKEVKEEVRRFADKFQDYIEVTKSAQNFPNNCDQSRVLVNNNVVDFQPTSDLKTKVIKQELCADIDNIFPQSSVDLTECFQDIEVPKLVEVPHAMINNDTSTNIDIDVTSIICDDNDADDSSFAGFLPESPPSVEKKKKAKRNRKSFPRKLQVDPHPSSDDFSGDEVVNDHENMTEITDNHETNEEPWMQFATIRNNIFYCNRCKQNFSQRGALKKHCIVHAAEIYNCNICFQSFQRCEDLKHHKNNDHIELPTNVEIKENSSFRNMNDSAVIETQKSFFLKTANGTKRNKITTITNRPTPVGYPQMKMQDLKARKRGPSSGHKFILPLHHRKNVKIKNNRKFYHCDICFKSFVYTSQSYQRHMMIHTGERPFKCDFCNKGFIRAANLKMHIRIHTGEKPYKCHMCSKQFRMRSGLTTHLRSIHSTDADAVHWV